MPSCKLIALSRPLPGREEDFHDWYQNTHLPELVNTLKMKGAQRYRLVAKLMGALDNEYLAIYDIECDDPAAFMREMGAAGSRFTPSDASDRSVTYSALFAECDKRVEPA